jgi:DNA-binding transcriptional ArsR family regulator
MAKTADRHVTKCLKAFANGRRLWLLEELLRSRELTVSELARRIQLSHKSTSKHLQKLAECDLIDRDQRSSEVYCRPNRQHPLLRAILPHLGR